MSADWYFIKHGWFHHNSRVGPLSETDLLARIDKGEIEPETLLQSDSKTKGKWVRMREVPPALDRWVQRHPPAKH
jgi:hypothetical protein